MSKEHILPKFFKRPERGSFQEIYERICLVTGEHTQALIAEVLGIRQSSISDAKRRNTVPDSWILTLWEKFNASPSFLLYGKGRAFCAEPEENPLLGVSEGTLKEKSPFFHLCDVPVFQVSHRRPLGTLPLVFSKDDDFEKILPKLVIYASGSSIEGSQVFYLTDSENGKVLASIVRMDQ